jgi:hypothetical protein
MAEQATPEHRIGLGDQALAQPSPSPPASPAAPTAGGDDDQAIPSVNGPFGAQLGPVLLQQCDGRLSAINWFRTDWQRGGALTGYATWTGEEGEAYPVVVKMPVPPRERLWLDRLQQTGGDTPVAPRLFAHGDSLNGYDLAWVVMERLPHGPLSPSAGGAAFELTIAASARFYKLAEAHAPTGKPLQRDWDDVCKRARKVVREHELPDSARWSAALKKAHKKLKKWGKVWEQRPITGHIHGDLHLGNALSRHQTPQGPALLIDYAHTRPGHWVEDAVYFEHLYWSHTELLDGHRIAAEIAKARKALGLEVDADWPRLAQVKRALFAMQSPLTLPADGARAHLDAALEVLEREVG